MQQSHEASAEVARPNLGLGVGNVECRELLLHLLLQQEIDPLSIRLIAFFLGIVFLIPIIKWTFRQLKKQVELFLAAANQEGDEEMEG